MPIMNGYEASKKIKKIRPELPIIAVTACIMQEDREKARESGIDDFISKPFNKNVLIKLLNKHLKIFIFNLI